MTLGLVLMFLVLVAFWQTCRAPLYAGNGQHGLVIGLVDASGTVPENTVPAGVARQQLSTYRLFQFRLGRGVYLIEWW